METTAVRPAYFNAEYLTEPENHYVCWLDVMGTGSKMTRSLATCANHVCKLHVAALEALEGHQGGRPPRLYPVMDGIYITCKRKGPLLHLLSATLRRVVETFLQERHPQLRFLVRGAIAYGPIVHGADIDQRASHAIRDHPDYWKCMLLGMPMVQAYRGESQAPPFGIYVDESARAFCGENETRFKFIWWDWFSRAQPELDFERLWALMDDYFRWCERFTVTNGYDVKDIQRHKQLAEEYFNRPRRTAATVTAVQVALPVSPAEVPTTEAAPTDAVDDAPILDEALGALDDAMEGCDGDDELLEALGGEPPEQHDEAAPTDTEADAAAQDE